MAYGQVLAEKVSRKIFCWSEHICTVVNVLFIKKSTTLALRHWHSFCFFSFKLHQIMNFARQRASITTEKLLVFTFQHVFKQWWNAYTSKCSVLQSKRESCYTLCWTIQSETFGFALYAITGRAVSTYAQALLLVPLGQTFVLSFVVTDTKNTHTTKNILIGWDGSPHLKFVIAMVYQPAFEYYYICSID